MLLATSDINKIPKEVRRMASAWHEAGHVVTAVLLGRDVKGAILRAPDGLSGECQFNHAPHVRLNLKEAQHRAIAEDAVVVLLAGHISETHYWHMVRLLYTPRLNSQRDDDMEIERYVQAFNFSPLKKADYIKHCRDRAAAMLETPQVDKARQEIASVLSNTLLIDRAAIDDIIRKHGC